MPPGAVHDFDGVDRPGGRCGRLQVLGEVLRGAGVLCAVHRLDGQRRQGDAGVQRGDGRVVPVGDRAVEDLGQHRRGQDQAVDAGDVVGQRDRAGDHRQVDRVVTGAAGRLGGRRLVLLQRRVGAGEVDLVGDEVRDALTGAAAAVGVDVGAAHVVEVGDPLLHDLALRGRTGRAQVALGAGEAGTLEGRRLTGRGRGPARTSPNRRPMSRLRQRRSLRPPLTWWWRCCCHSRRH